MISGDIYLFSMYSFYYIFFAVGDMFGKMILDPKNYKIFSSNKTFFIFAPLFILLEFFFTRINMAHGMSQGTGNLIIMYKTRCPHFFLIVGLIGGAFLIHCSFLLQKLNILKWVRIIGYHSLYIYAIHLAVTAAIRIFFRNVLHYDEFFVLLGVSTVLGIVVPIVFFNITDRLGMWWLFTLKNPNASQKTRSDRLENRSR